MQLAHAGHGNTDHIGYQFGGEILPSSEPRRIFIAGTSTDDEKSRM
jgi:hypothetical protein